MLEAIIKSEPVTYAESCGAKIIVPSEHSSVKVTTLPAAYQHTKRSMPCSRILYAVRMRM